MNKVAILFWSEPQNFPYPQIQGVFATKEHAEYAMETLKRKYEFRKFDIKEHIIEDLA